MWVEIKFWLENLFMGWRLIIVIGCFNMVVVGEDGWFIIIVEKVFVVVGFGGNGGYVYV